VCAICCAIHGPSAARNASNTIRETSPLNAALGWQRLGLDIIQFDIRFEQAKRGVQIIKVDNQMPPGSDYRRS
jgi:hypothetical protein